MFYAKGLVDSSARSLLIRATYLRERIRPRPWEEIFATGRNLRLAGDIICRIIVQGYVSGRK